MPHWRHKLRDNLAQAQQRLVEACNACGRAPSEVQLVAVTKYVPSEVAVELVAAGCRELGESRPQSLWAKAEDLRHAPVRWHMIGHLQRNKVNRTLPLVGLFQSLDSLRLMQAINDDCRQRDATLEALLEINISGDAAKHGFAPEEAAEVVAQMPQFERIRLKGLMGMSGLEATPAQAQRQFASLRELRERLAADAPPEVELHELSMGMSNDFPQAIAEGATIVRVGSALFEGMEL